MCSFSKTPWLVFFPVYLTLFGCSQLESPLELELHDKWTFKSVEDSVWRPASVPGTIHVDLLENGLIEDPFYRLNEHELQWIDKKDWEYRTRFHVSRKWLQNEEVELCFDGLDTYATVFLNGRSIEATDNMHRGYIVPLKHFLKEGENLLRIVFDSPIRRGIQKYDQLGYKFPDLGNDLAEIGKVEGQKQVSVFSRKAGYHFGWDWGPRLVTSGIWKSVELRSWSGFRVDELHVAQDILPDRALLTAQIQIDATPRCNGETVNVDVVVNENIRASMKHQLVAGKNEIEVPFEILQPKLWWPNGLGEQAMYNITVCVSSDNYTDSLKRRIGLRTIELVQEPDSFGTSFYFRVNGVPVFMKGANYIPQDVFLTRPTNRNYDFLLTSAEKAHMNMIRVWGGGIYENDMFYDLCDEKGLLIWQDFMFACAMYPGDSSFVNNVEKEAEHQVRRLRHHPSIALWCGNNENLSAWENWGWKDLVTAEQGALIADSMWRSYEKVFHEVLPSAVKKWDESRPYWSSSPSSSTGVTESMTEGDAHYWWVWWGKKPFENYTKAIPRFMSEFGFQSFPEFSSVQKYTASSDHDIYSEVMTSHQRSSIGNETIEEYMLRDFNPPKDFESFLYVSQLLQAYGVETGIAAHRRNRHRCMGTLYWQLNDCWPVASWSSIDYYGKWKALHYAAKKSFETLIISSEIVDSTLNIYVISDSLQHTKGLLELSLMDFEGNQTDSWRDSIQVLANQSNVYFAINLGEFSSKINFNESLLCATFKGEDQRVLAEKYIYFARQKNLLLPEAKIDFTVEVDHDDYLLTISSDKFAKSVFVFANSPLNFSDNYFDLLPGSSKTIRIPHGRNTNFQNFKNSIEIRSLRDTYP